MACGPAFVDGTTAALTTVGSLRSKTAAGEGTAQAALFRGSLGPLIFTLITACEPLVEFLLAARAVGPPALAVLGFADLFKYLLIAVIRFPAAAGVKWLLALMAERKPDEAAQLFADLARLTALVWLLFRVGSQFVFFRVGTEFGAEIQNAIYPLSSLSFMIAAFQFSCEFFIQENRPVAFLVIHATRLAMHVVLLTLFLFKLELSVWAVSVSYCLSAGLPGIVALLVLLDEKIAVKHECFLNWPSAYFARAVRSALPELLPALSQCFGVSVFYRCLFPAFDTDLLSALAVVTRLDAFIRQLSLPFIASFAFNASAAWSLHQHRRILTLAFLALALALVPQLLLSPVMVRKPSAFASAFLVPAAPCDRLLWSVCLGNLLLPVVELGTGLLFATQLEGRFLIARVARGMAFGAASFVLHWADRTDPAKLLLAFPSADLLMFLVVSLLAPPAVQRRLAARDAD
jgi:hypothetical protein